MMIGAGWLVVVRRKIRFSQDKKVDGSGGQFGTQHGPRPGAGQAPFNHGGAFQPAVDFKYRGRKSNRPLYYRKAGTTKGRLKEEQTSIQYSIAHAWCCSLPYVILPCQLT
jgi:hypothetical protein